MKALADKIQASENHVLQYNRDRGSLPWEWYVWILDSTVAVKYSMGLA
jgi:hypothetical protein